MTANDERRDWSFVSSEKFEEYVRQSQKIIAFAKEAKIHPFAAALAGVAFIRNALHVMGGQVEWWLEFVRTGKPGGPWWVELARTGKPGGGPKPGNES